MFFKTKYFTFNCIIKGLYLSSVFSAFIYLEYFNITNELFNSLLGLIAIYLFLDLKRESLFWGGFFTALLWFWWIGLSFTYYDLGYLIPFILISIGLIYGFLFALTTIGSKLFIRALLLLALSFTAPFGFNWFKPELIFINSYFDTSKLSFALIIISMALLIKSNKKIYKLLSLIPLAYAINTDTPHMQLPPLTIYMAQFNIDQNDKWNKELKSDIYKLNISRIKHAIAENYDVVVLPETAFPTLLNKNTQMMAKLKKLSKDIAIITGAMYQNGDKFHNSTYFFHKGKVEVAHKVVLVPFGEAVPLPEKLRNLINDTFYNGAQDYTTAEFPTDFIIKDVKLRNAICYEATTNKIFENNPKYLIALSNNAWFTPSIQPTLQKLLMKYYARKYNTTIFSISNKSENQIIF